VRRLASAAALGAALLAALIVRWPALRAPFFADDWLFLDQVRSRSLVGALFAPDPIGNFFRPLGRAAWFWTLARFSHESARSFHVANLVLFLVALVLLWSIARRAAGERAAAMAVALFAVTQAADVPVLWASGSQDLLALVLVLAATRALMAGSRRAAAALFVAALLAKEVVVFALIPAAPLARRSGETPSARARRLAPAATAVFVWACIAAVLLARRGAATGLSFDPLGVPAALVGAVRTAFGLEWMSGHSPFAWRGVPSLSALAAVGLAVVAALLALDPGAPRDRLRYGSAPRRTGDGAGAALVWWIAGAIPVAAVAPIWSAYFFLYATCGAVLFFGIVLSYLPRPLAATIVGLLALGARQAGELREFATAPGRLTAQSHLNARYLERGMDECGRAIAALLQQHSTLPPRTTIFFSGLPAFAAFQAGDGPLLRGVYRDSSLRSYYLKDLTRARASRGPVRFLSWDDNAGRFRDPTGEPDLMLRVGMAQLLGGHVEAARAALGLSRAGGSIGREVAYLSAFLALEDGDSAAATASLAKAGYDAARGGTEVLSTVNRWAAARDTNGAIGLLESSLRRHGLEPALHGRLADLLLASPSRRPLAPPEAYAARVLAPNAPGAWRRWAVQLAWQNRPAEALVALDRYFALAPEAAGKDAAAVALREAMRARAPGGEAAQKAMARP
jgi:hypothetical protein